MEVVKCAVDLQSEGSSLGEETDQANTEDRNRNFEKRIDEICNTLTQWKYRKSNAKKAATSASSTPILALGKCSGQFKT